MKKMIFIILAGLVVLVAAPMPLLASSNKLPEVMVGQTTVTQAGKKFYGGSSGNESVVNFVADYLMGFDKSYLQSPSDCYNGNLQSAESGCYAFSNSSSDPQGLNLGLSLLRSRTYINSSPLIETAALFNKPRLIRGDTFGTMTGFETWGQNLSQVSSGNPYGSAPWKIKKYNLNPAAQAAWTGPEFAEYLAAISNLANEAAVVGPDDIGTIQRNWFLQAPGNEIYNNSPEEKNTYPDGKVWLAHTYPNAGAGIVEVKDLTIAGGTTYYYGVGTIVVKGNFSMNDGAKLVPANPATDRLGIIVLDQLASGATPTLSEAGNCTFGSNVVLRAAVLCRQTFSVPSGKKNIDFTGSFVANNFNVMNNDENYNIRFNYDYNLSKNWPPGFRSLNMPKEN